MHEILDPEHAWAAANGCCACCSPELAEAAPPVTVEDDGDVLFSWDDYCEWRMREAQRQRAQRAARCAGCADEFDPCPDCA